MRPLVRTLRRLRHDLIMIGRVAVAPFTDTFKERLAPLVSGVAEAAADYLHRSGAALASLAASPAPVALESAIDYYEAEVAVLRQEGLMRDLPSEVLERIFALGFALEQLRRNLKDLSQRVTDLAKDG